MTPVAANPEVQSPVATRVVEPQVIAAEPETAASPEVFENPAPLTPARQFLDRTDLIEKLAPLRELNQQIRLEHPQMDDLFKILEANPEITKRFLKLANGPWFNSRVQVDSAYMAFTRFGTEGFYRLTLGAFISERIGELTTKFKIWPHLDSVATAGEMLAQQLAPNFLDEVFAAGLLHDAIVPPMERELQDYLYFLECALSMDPVVTGLENRCHDFDHAQAAGELARALSFDEHIVEAIASHHHESMSSVSAGNSRVILGLLLTAKRTLSLARGQKKNAFETATEKALMREISAALGVSSGRLINAIADVVDTLKLQDS